MVSSAFSSADPVSTVFLGLPTFFRASCAEAARGGGDGYLDAGWTLAVHVCGFVEPLDDGATTSAKLDELADLLDRARRRFECREDVLRWLDREFPRCMRLVPRRRRTAFVRGVLKAADEERIFD